MNDCIFTLDAGGTYLKYALMTGEGEPLPDAQGQSPAPSSGTREEIEAAFRAVGRFAREHAAAHGLRLAGMAVSFPGPFDFDAGISRMAHKYAAIRDVPLTPLLTAETAPVPVSYLHDSTAFLLGEAVRGAAVGCARPAGVMLGTGLGFAAMADGRVLVNPAQGPRLSLWNVPYGQGICEDAVSRRAILRAYGGDPALDVKDIARMAFAGDQCARAVFDRLAEDMAAILAPVLALLHTDVLVVGGQIAKSGTLFLPRLEARLGLPVRAAALIANGALYGAWYYACHGRAACVQAGEPIILN